MCKKSPAERNLYDLPLLKLIKLPAAAVLLAFPIAPLSIAYLSYSAGNGFETVTNWGLPWWIFAFVFPSVGLAMFGLWVQDMQQLKEDQDLHLDTLAAIVGLGFVLAFVLTN